VERVCDSCLAGKQHHTLFPAQAKRWAESVLELIHNDLCGPVTPATSSGNKYFLLLVDDMSRYMWPRLLPSKDQTPSEIKNFHATVEVETGKKLKVLHTEQGGEFTSVEFRQYCVERGVEHQLIAPLFPAAKRGGRAAQPEHDRHGTVHAQGYFLSLASNSSICCLLLLANKSCICSFK
jgi:hypothetical protein